MTTAPVTLSKMRHRRGHEADPACWAALRAVGAQQSGGWESDPAAAANETNEPGEKLQAGGLVPRGSAVRRERKRQVQAALDPTGGLRLRLALSPLRPPKAGAQGLSSVSFVSSAVKHLGQRDSDCRSRHAPHF